MYRICSFVAVWVFLLLTAFVLILGCCGRLHIIEFIWRGRGVGNLLQLDIIGLNKRLDHRDLQNCRDFFFRKKLTASE
jgi:hypothetical protein